MRDEKEKQKDYMKINRLRWEELVNSHKNSNFYNIEKFKQGKSSLLPLELEELQMIKNIKDKSLLHLQCHFGIDSLSLARMGFNVTGVDFSKPAIDYAKELSSDLNIPATFICANIYDLNTIIKKKFDYVFTSWGVLPWLPDLNKWANIITNSLISGGTFYIFELHPFSNTIDEKIKEKLVIKYPYQTTSSEPYLIDEKGTYADSNAKFINTKRYEWSHSLGEIITSLIQANLRIEQFNEYPLGIFQFHPDMKRLNNGLYQFENIQANLPLTFSIKAIKP